MAQRVRLIQARVKLEKEESTKTSTRVRLNSAQEEKTSSRVRLAKETPAKTSTRVRLRKTPPGQKYFMSKEKPHLHTRIVMEPTKHNETIYWMPVPQADGKILYDRLVIRKDNNYSRALLDATSTYGLAQQYKQFQGLPNQWIPGYLKQAKHRGW